MSEIRVAQVYLENLSRRLQSTASDMRAYTDIGTGTLACSPIVNDAYHKLGDRWDTRRGELADSLEALAEGFMTASASFGETDSRLAQQLPPSGAE
jgi:hypothetical protein